MTDTTATRTTGAVAAGLATVTEDGTVLDTWYPAPVLSDEPGPAGTERLTADRAAELLGVPQPTVSRRLAALADALGAPLTVPDGRGIRLTRAAELLAEAAERGVGEGGGGAGRGGGRDGGLGGGHPDGQGRGEGEGEDMWSHWGYPSWSRW